ncbi:TPA: hypothetical protein ACNTG9_005222, partial [Escherichia coli]
HHERGRDVNTSRRERDYFLYTGSALMLQQENEVRLEVYPPTKNHASAASQVADIDTQLPYRHFYFQ